MSIAGLQSRNGSYYLRKTLSEDNISELDDTIFTADAVEVLMFPNKIWRFGRWVENDGVELVVNLEKAYESSKDRF